MKNQRMIMMTNIMVNTMVSIKTITAIKIKIIIITIKIIIITITINRKNKKTIKFKLSLNRKQIMPETHPKLYKKTSINQAFRRKSL